MLCGATSTPKSPWCKLWRVRVKCAAAWSMGDSEVFLATHGRTGGSNGISPRPSRITKTTAPIAAARQIMPIRTRAITKARDIAIPSAFNFSAVSS